MSKKIAIISDSSAGLTEEMLSEYNIYTSYLMVIFGNDSYQEFKELTPDKFSQLSATQDELPTTSQPAPGLTIELYEDLIGEGYEKIIHITISSGLSGSYQSAMNAAEIVDAEKIHVFDSKSVSFAQGALAIAASRMAKAGKHVAEIIAELENMQKTMYASATVKSLENLKKGGRLSNASAVIGSMLQIKPVVVMSPEGKLEAVSKVRTFKKAMQALIEAAKAADLDETYEIAVVHALNIEDATTVKNAISEFYPNITIHLLPLSLVIVAHIGEGSVALAWAKIA